MLRGTKNLIVTGNGFDLYCGLNSTFKKFIESKYDEINNSYNSYLNYKSESIGKILRENINNFYLIKNEDKTKFLNLFPLIHINDKKELDTVIEELQFYHNPNSAFFKERKKLKGLTEIKDELLSSTQRGYLKFLEDSKRINKYNFWEILLVLYGSYEKSWYDIEKEMSNFLLNSNRKNFIIDEIQTQYDSFLNNNISKIPHDLSPKIEFLLFTILNKNVGKELSVENFLKEELFRFENKFAEFIKKDIQSHTDYKYKRRDLFNKLNRLTNSHRSNVLTFNYTMSKHPHNIKKVKSVHGSIYNSLKNNHSNIIFGIDANINYPDFMSETSKKTIYSYTKTYRTLNYQFNNNEDTVLDKNIKNIIFFGHSLGDSDYSYFQSIFDYYNLYHSEVSLYFIFSPHGGSSDIYSREKQSDKVINLLKNYGNTLENKDHGLNLIHKLIIEDRLKIENLNNII